MKQSNSEEEDPNTIRPLKLRVGKVNRNLEQDFILPKDTKEPKDDMASNKDNQLLSRDNNLSVTAGLRHNKSSLIFKPEQVNRLAMKDQEENESEVVILSVNKNKNNNMEVDRVENIRNESEHDLNQNQNV